MFIVRMLTVKKFDHFFTTIITDSMYVVAIVELKKFAYAGTIDVVFHL